jgi:hypothetical protein
VQVLGQQGQPAEQRVAEHRQQHVLAEQHDQAGEPEHAEADGGAPVHHLLGDAEARHQPAARTLVQLDRALGEVQRRDDQQDQDHQPAAEEGHGPVAELPPGLARRRARVLADVARRRLDKHVHLPAGQAREVRRSALHLAPYRRVIPGLRDLALLLRLLRGRRRRILLRGLLRRARPREREGQQKKKHPHAPLLFEGRPTYW